MMKKAFCLFVALLCGNALYAMNKVEQMFQKASQRIKDKEQLFIGFRGLAEGSWKDEVIPVIRNKLDDFEKTHGSQALNELKKEVLNYPEALQEKLKSAKNNQRAQGILCIGSSVLVGISLWLGLSHYSKGQTLLGTCINKGLCAVGGSLSALCMYTFGDLYFNDVADAQQCVNRYAQYENQVEALFN